MSTTKNKATMRKFYTEVMNKGKFDLLDKLVAKDFVEHSPPPRSASGNQRPQVRAEVVQEGFPRPYHEGQ
ncbi:MAG: ester cyclase [Thaumarchaeota archaeon]|nr:ester cyclase [Nitrososphaerota archaeon]